MTKEFFFRAADEFPIKETLHPLSPVDRTVHLHSGGLGWAGLYVSWQTVGPSFTQYEACENPSIMIALNGPVSIRRYHGTIEERVCLRKGQFNIIPAGMAFSLKLETAFEFLHVYLHRAFMDEVGRTLINASPAPAELVPISAGTDPLIEQLLLEIFEETKKGEHSSAPHVDQLGRILAESLLRAYSCPGRQRTKVRQEPLLEKAHLERVVHLVGAHLSSPLPVSRLARETGHCPAHFARLFKKATGLTLHRFVLETRLKRVANMLAYTDIALPNIAADCGFVSRETMSKLFEAFMGTTPFEYRHRHRKAAGKY